VEHAIIVVKLSPIVVMVAVVAMAQDNGGIVLKTSVSYIIIL